MPNWFPYILCSCGFSIPDELEARQGHEDFWHSEKYPAEYGTREEMETGE